MEYVIALPLYKMQTVFLGLHLNDSAPDGAFILFKGECLYTFSRYLKILFGNRLIELTEAVI